MKKRAFITGVTGQDGSYLSEFLLKKEYEVFGLIRRNSTSHKANVAHLIDNPSFRLLPGDINDPESIAQALDIAKPTEIYNLAAQSFVGTAWESPNATMEATGTSVGKLLTAVRRQCPEARVYQASSSEMFGNPRDYPQGMTTGFRPRSPYGIAKLAAHWTAINYRESYDMFVCCGILFNHESPRRGIEFVTQKIAHGVAYIKERDHKYKIKLGNINAVRDWGYAPEYVEAMWMMLQRGAAEEFVVGTGCAHTVNQFYKACCLHAGLENPDLHLEIDESLMRPAEVPKLLAYTEDTKAVLGWESKTTFMHLVQIMVDAQRAKLKKPSNVTLL